MACCGSPTGFSDKTPTSVPAGQKWGFARYSLHIPGLRSPLCGKFPVESIVAEKEEEADEFDEEQVEEERRERLMKEMLEARKKKVFARKMPKRLPKFMLRPVPEEPEGIMYENFRMFIKWALLYNAQLKRQEYLPKMECVAVNLPAEYAFLIDKANAEEEKSELPFEYLGDLGNENVGGNLDLVGALYTGIYNKRQNF